ncbi:MAG: hypothetical protein HQ519_10700 [Planctomycetes bacterium]|nr:hypothetical protein [Planctomycetota bacterium]
MIRGTVLLCIAAALFSAHSCQSTDLEGVTATQIAEKLLSNGGQPYGCTVQSKSQSRYDDPTGVATRLIQGEMLHSSAWVSCDLYHYKSGYPKRVFEKRAKGLVHILRVEIDGEWEEDQEWDCGSISGEVTPIWGSSIYLPGGWDLCSQAGGFIKSFPPDRIEVVDSELLLYWDNATAELKNEFELQLYYAIRAEDYEIESIKIGVDYRLGVPTSFDLALKSGEFISTIYQDFEFLGNSYPARLKELRAKINVPAFVKCPCDGEIYQVQVKLPGRPLVKLK